MGTRPPAAWPPSLWSPRPPMRVLPDTNIWGRLVDEAAVETLRKRSRAQEDEVAIAPAVVYELLRTGNPARRRVLVEAATRGSWTRLMTEVYEECQDVL